MILSNYLRLEKKGQISRGNMQVFLEEFYIRNRFMTKRERESIKLKKTIDNHCPLQELSYLNKLDFLILIYDLNPESALVR